MPDPPRSSDLLPSEIQPHLRGKCFGRAGIHHYWEIGSTNDRARELAREGCPQGTVVVAETQRSGRGRLGRSWESPPGGGLYFSLVLRPAFPLAEAPRVTLMAGVAVCKAIRGCSHLQARIKWPNDILIHGRKVAGILTEMEGCGGQISHLVVGVGINVNTPRSAWPPALGQKASSLAEEGGRAFSRPELLGDLLGEMEALWEVLHHGGFEPIRQAWKSFSVTLGVEVRVEGKGMALVGRAVDLGGDGSLLILGEDGCEHRVSYGEVTIAPV